jgi:hypothetical protein
VKWLLFVRNCHGWMAKPMMAARYPPRRIFCVGSLQHGTWGCSKRVGRLTMKRGKSAVRSHPALIEFAEIFVPEHSHRSVKSSWHLTKEHTYRAGQ